MMSAIYDALVHLAKYSLVFAYEDSPDVTRGCGWCQRYAKLVPVEEEHESGKVKITMYDHEPLGEFGIHEDGCVLLEFLEQMNSTEITGRRAYSPRDP